MKRFLITIFLTTLIIAGDILSAFAQGEVKVLVRQIGISTYSYKLINLSSNPVTSLQIGFNRYRKDSEEELTMVPTNIESPQGWKGENIFLEESDLLHIDWYVSDLATYTYAIQPGGSLDGFIVYMPEPYDLMKQTYFTVIYGTGKRVWDSAQVQIDTSIPILYNGKGQKHSDVNTFLSYLKPLQAHTTLTAGKNYYYLLIFYGQTIMPETFKAELNGKDITNSFHPRAGESDAVKLNFKKGKNTLALIIDGKKSNGKRKTDIDRFVFIVQ